MQTVQVFSIIDEKNKEVNIIVIYRKPGANLLKKEWLKFLEQFANTDTIITGDFNAHKNGTAEEQTEMERCQKK